MSLPLTPRQRRAFIAGEVARTLAVVVLICAVGLASFHRDAQFAQGQRSGCVRSRQRIHLLAKDATRRGLPGLAKGLLATIPPDCNAAYPLPGPFALR